MEEEKLKVKKLDDELLTAEAKVKEMLKKLDADYKETKAKGGQ